MKPTPATRLHPRATLKDSVKVTVPGQVDRSLAVLVDISESGAQLSSELKLYPATPVELYWVPVAGLPPLLLEAEVVWSRLA